MIGIISVIVLLISAFIMVIADRKIKSILLSHFSIAILASIQLTTYVYNLINPVDENAATTHFYINGVSGAFGEKIIIFIGFWMFVFGFTIFIIQIVGQSIAKKTIIKI